MINDLLLLIKKHIHTLIEQAKTKPQERLEFKMNTQMQTFSFNPPMNLSEEEKCLIALTIFGATNSAFNITDENNSLILTTPGHWRIPNNLPEGNNNKLRELLELGSQHDIKFHVEELKKTRKSDNNRRQRI